jgi:hypothetical protein
MNEDIHESESIGDLESIIDTENEIDDIRDIDRLVRYSWLQGKHVDNPDFGYLTMTILTLGI